ncbi:MAG: hypothetical protein IJ308_00275 [Clostridia bacterium]|nr:hypothetical protein [Clostridia bacterium]
MKKKTIRKISKPATLTEEKLCELAYVAIYFMGDNEGHSDDLTKNAFNLSEEEFEYLKNYRDWFNCEED